MLQFGLIGCGDIGRLRAAAVARSGEGRLRVVCDADGSRAAAVASAHGAMVEPEWRSVVARADVDALIVSTPPSLHAEMCTAALDAGKHVLCEKPLARTPAEGRAIVDAATRSHRLLATGFNYRFYPSIQKAREILATGVIGELDHVRSYAGYSAKDHGHAWIHDAAIMGGGALRDNGIHLIDLTRSFLGEVAEVVGFSSNAVWGFDGCEDNGFALLRSPTGTIASLHASWTEWRGYRLVIELYGSRGCIRVSCFPMLTSVTAASERGGRTRRRMHFFPLTHLGEHLRSYRWVVVRSFIEEFRAFARAVRGEPTPLATGHDGLRALEIADAVSLGGGAAQRLAAEPQRQHAGSVR